MIDQRQSLEEIENEPTTALSAVAAAAAEQASDGEAELGEASLTTPEALTSPAQMPASDADDGSDRANDAPTLSSAETAATLDGINYAEAASIASSHDEAESAMIGGRCGCAMCWGVSPPHENIEDPPETIAPSNKPVYTNQQIIDNFRRTIDGSSSTTWPEGETITWGVYTADPGFFSTGGFFFGQPDTTGGFRAANQDLVDGLARAFGVWDEVLDIDFEFTTNVSNADIRVGFNDGNHFAYAYFPNPQVDGWYSDIWLNYNQLDSQPANSIYSYEYGTYGLLTLIHEIGHNMGLPHPGQYDASQGIPLNYNDHAEYAQDTRGFSVMSYFEANNYQNWDHRGPNGFTHYASTLQVHDLLALHDLYRPETTTRTGDSTYGFNATEAGSLYDFNSYGFNQYNGPIFTIFDSSGTDTLDFSGATTGTSISLVEGTHSSIFSMTNNIGIAFGTVIENAVGGVGVDTISGNAVNNVLTGNGGNDVINGSGGNDRLIGGAGNDTLTAGSASAGVNSFTNVGFAIQDFAPQAGGWTNDSITPRHLIDVNNDGVIDVVGFGSSSVLVALGTGTGQFANPIVGLNNYGTRQGWANTTNYPRELVDVNGDGIVDIVGFGTAGVGVSLGNGDGTFANQISGVANFGINQGWTDQGVNSRHLVDVNGDGRLDIVGFGSSATLAALGDGTGQFGSTYIAINNFSTVRHGWASQDNNPRWFVDVNNDGFVDILGAATLGLVVALNNGQGQFNEPTFALQNFAPAQGWLNQTAYPRLLGDVNGDGALDILGFGTSGVLVSYGNGQGLFQDPVFALADFGQRQGWTNNDIVSRELADVNGDGALDIVGFGSVGVMVSLNNGNGTFGASQRWSTDFDTSSGFTSQNAFPRTLADMDGDGAEDVVAVTNGGIVVAESNGRSGDTFAFTSLGWGNDSITDWNSADVLDFRGTGLNPSQMTISQQGSDVVISTAVSADTVTLVGTGVGQVTFNDMIFA